MSSKSSKIKKNSLVRLGKAKAINPLALLCIGDVIAILTGVKFAILMLATLVIFFNLLIELFLMQKVPNQHKPCS